MLKEFCVLFAKDVKLLFAEGAWLVQALLLGLVLIFVFSLAANPGDKITAQQSITIFWLASSFSLVLLFNALFSLDESNELSAALQLSPASPYAFLFSKLGVGFLFLYMLQLIFLAALVVFLGQGIQSPLWLFLLIVFIIDFGLTLLGTVFGAAARGQGARDTLLSILIFPLEIPLLLAGIKIGTQLLAQGTLAGVFDWLQLMLAFDSVFLGATLLLFPIIFKLEV